MILAIESSAANCSVGFVSEKGLVAEFYSEAPMKHSEQVGVFVEKGLQEINDKIHLVCVALGPGSFTGLRIGLSYALGFCFGRNIPIVGVSNHQVLAALRKENMNTFTAIDAHRQELYLAKHRLNETVDVEFLKIIGQSDLADELPQYSQLIYFKGSLSEEVLKNLSGKEILTIEATYKISTVADLGKKIYKTKGADDPEKIQPLYIRPFAGVK